MSSNANLVAFSLDAGPSDPAHPGVFQVYVRNIAPHTTTLVEQDRLRRGRQRQQPRRGDVARRAVRLLHLARRRTWVPGDTNRHADVFVRDRRRGTTRRIDVGMHGQTNGDSFALGISAGGRFRLFESWATNIVAGDTNRAADLFLRDRATGRTIRVD